LIDWDDIARRPLEEQVAVFHSYLENEPSDAGIWFDLGLAYKRLRNWKGSIAANLRALDLSSEPEDPAWWNLGIAATALRDWELARRAWRGYGLEIPGESGPIACDYGLGPVRIGDEVVWGDRIDPARFKILSIPLPKSGFGWHDIVLHDGEPNGEREAGGQTYPVFDALERWEASGVATLTVEVTCEREEDSAALIELFESNGFGAEDWTANVRNLCKACSEGQPGAHEHPLGPPKKTRTFGIASPQDLAGELLELWKVAAPAYRAVLDS
jgi:tetratricopeptide (TPR) repeat protein